MPTPVPYFPFSLQPNTLLGRLSAGVGAPEAIPFGSLASVIALNGTSVTSLTIGTGSKTLITQANLPLGIGELVVVANTAAPSNFMFGQVTSYSPLTGSLTVNVTATGGSGTYIAWTITASGPQGATGAAGTAGGLLIGTGGGTVSAITTTIGGASTADTQMIAVVSAGANTSTTPTLKLNSDTAHTITARGGLALKIGDIGPAGFVGIYEYNSANTRWELLNPALVTNYKVVNTTFDAATATGTISITGVGFRPRFCVMLSAFPTTNTEASIGWSDGTTEMAVGSYSAVTPGNFIALTASLGVLYEGSSIAQTFSIATGGGFTADGATIANTKIGAANGVFNISLAFFG